MDKNTFIGIITVVMLVSFATFAFLFVITQNPIVGEWEFVKVTIYDENDTIVTSQLTEDSSSSSNWEFLSNGTLITTFCYNGNESIDYFQYTISGEDLTITDSDGEVNEYTFDVADDSLYMTVPHPYAEEYPYEGDNPYEGWYYVYELEKV